ncbi:MAG TPA: TraR/DksA C4-type zinc finger protein [Flavisolibacter sp.]|jgi:RNA polymerase-binding transcription factor DksA|nr:TraR/DksA C4-type zinc finger protein [Flavisolibacter sp.]
MATKKQAPKKAAKAAKPAKKAPAPKAAPKKAAKPAAKKAVAKKPAPAPKKAAVKAPAPKKAVKAAKPAPKPAAKKAAPAPVKKVAAPAKKATPAPAKQAEPVKKPSVAAPTHQEVKPAIKPLPPAPPKKEVPKAPVKVVIPKTSTNKAVKYEPDFTKSVLDSHQHEQTGPTMRYSDGELVEFRELINKKLETAKKELAYLQGLITRKDEGGDMEDGRYMTMEDGSMSMEREQLSQMASRQIQFIDHLEKAIMRIENKTYGVCRVTGKLIDKARLRAVPHATLSIEAKQMMNK